MSTSTEGMQIRSGPGALRSVVELMSSMRFAISLLTVICIASVVGTVLKQHEPFNNYVNQFGPFWADVFSRIDLYSVYSAWWFLLVLAFLVTSTSLCIARNTPKIMADLKAYKENVREQSLRAFRHRAEAVLPGSAADQAQRIGQWLAASGWKVRLQQREGADGQPGGWMVAAKAGAANKVGYLAAHSAIVLVCIGGLLDGDLMVRAQMWFGGRQTYAGGGMLHEIPAQHRLSSATPAFRGNLLVAEGTRSGTAILNQPSGVLLQDLPFTIELRKFIIEHYSTGMPKLFASEIVIHDRETGAQTPARVEVNHPASYKGIEIYQSGFDDGGSAVKLRAIPMAAAAQGFDVEGTIGASTQLSRGDEKMTLEFVALRVINVENFSGGMGLGGQSGADVRSVDLGASIEGRLGAANKTMTQRELRNVGPSITYKLRDAAGQAREYHNYMLPVVLDGVPVYLLGVRDSPAEAFRYLRVPADDQGSMDGFLRLRAALADPARRAEAVASYVRQAVEPARPELAEQLRASASRALDLFAGEGAQGQAAGLQAISDFIDANVPQDERPRAGEVLIRILNGVLFELVQVDRQRAGLKPLPTDDATRAFMTQAVLSLGDAGLYPAPLTMQLREFQQVQASVFQVARAPGRNIVYLGCALLILGVFAMLYVRERRVWVWLAPQADGTNATMALSCNRQTLDVDREFTQLRDRLLTPKESA